MTLPIRSEAVSLATASYCEIPLTRGLVALVDAVDFDWLSEWKWHAHDHGYATRRGRVADGAAHDKSIFMHRVLLDAPSGLTIDHINGQTWDNRRRNLRLCTIARNQQNKSRYRNNRSGFKGVSWSRHRAAWIACICLNGRGQTLGSFADPVLAARAYDQAARSGFGEFARLNFPDHSDAA